MSNSVKKMLSLHRHSTAVHKVTAGMALLLLALTCAHGEYVYPNDPFIGEGFVKEDWQLVCDNSLTCRAAGYSTELAEWRASIMLTIKAGEKTADTQLLLNYLKSSENEPVQLQGADQQVELWLNNKSYGTVELATDNSASGKLSSYQTAQLIKQARQNTKIEFRAGNYQWQVSDIGMAAVLLKLDEVQGRVGTPLALVSNHAPNRQTPKKAKALPKIYAAYAYPVSEYPTYALAEDGSDIQQPHTQKYYQQPSAGQQQQWQNNMSAWAIATLNEADSESCEVLTSDSDSAWVSDERKVWQFTAIDSKHTLASYPCWTGAYNFGTGYWVIDNDNPSQPKLVTTSGSEYSAGEISVAHKSRGLGDCWWLQQWLWSADTFVMSSDKTTGLCRLISAGGAWDLPTYVSEVVGRSIEAD